MIQIKPQIRHDSQCPRCGSCLEPRNVLWQGIHVCVESTCPGCRAEIVEDLRVGQAMDTPYQVDVAKGELFGDEGCRSWLGEPLLRSLREPQVSGNVQMTVERLAQARTVVILNCLDYLYGHCLLKLLNAQDHLSSTAEAGLVVIVPRFLRWMVPDGVAEVWTVNLPLSRAQEYHPSLDEMIRKECGRFDEIYISPAFSHPKNFDITRFTRINRHDFNEELFRITFVWREDRLWSEKRWMVRVARRTRGMQLLLASQNAKVTSLFSHMRERFPNARFTVAGLGTETSFPEWVDDRRVETFDEQKERESCRIYAESRLVIGVHGSNLLLPSAHAGMTIDLMPVTRWCNFAQDIIYQENDCRMASYRYRYLPLGIPVAELAAIASRQLLDHKWFADAMVFRLPDGAKEESTP